MSKPTLAANTYPYFTPALRAHAVLIGRTARRAAKSFYPDAEIHVRTVYYGGESPAVDMTVVRRPVIARCTIGLSVSGALDHVSIDATEYRRVTEPPADDGPVPPRYA